MKIYLFYVILILVTVGLNTIAQKFLKQRWNLWLGCGVPAIGMMLFLWRVSTPPVDEWFGDFFVAYYPAGHLILQNTSDLYSTHRLGFVNIPIIALLFTPFTSFNRSIAIILFTILGILTILITYYFLIRLTKVSGWKKIALLGLFVINGPLYHSIWYGNLTHFVLLVLLLVFFCLKKKREFWLGILLVIAALIKIPLFLLGIYFATRRNWRVVAGFGAALLAIVGASLLLFGVELHLTWYHQCILPFAGKVMASFNVQSLDSFLARLAYSSYKWWPIDIDWRFKVIRYALLSLLVGTTVWVGWRSQPPQTLEVENLEFSIILCLALLISPISWTHYYLFLLLPFSLYLGNKLAVPQGRLWSSLVVTSILLTSLPVINAAPANPTLNFLYSRLLLSHYFLGGVLFLGILLAARWHTSKLSGLPQANLEKYRTG